MNLPGCLGSRLGAGWPPGAAKPRVFIMGYPRAGMSGTLGDLNAAHAYNNLTVHQNTVVGNEILVLDAVQRYPKGYNPGFVATNIRAKLLANPLMMTLIGFLREVHDHPARNYAERVTPLLLARQLDGRSGAMFNNKAQRVLATGRLNEASYRQKFLAERGLAAARGCAVGLRAHPAGLREQRSAFGAKRTSSSPPLIGLLNRFTALEG